MDWVIPPSVGGLKLINVDWNVISCRKGVHHITQSAHFVELNIYVEMATSGLWSKDETRALLDM